MSPRQKIQLIKISVISVVILLIAANVVVYIILNSYQKDYLVISEIKQIQTGLVDYYADQNYYPAVNNVILLNDVYSNSEKLCDDGFHRAADQCNKVYLPIIPDSVNGSGYYYKDISEGKNYFIEFELKHNIAGLNKGKNCASFGQIVSGSCQF